LWITECPRITGTSVIAIGIAVITGWIFQYDPLMRIHPDLIPMKANTAIAFVFAGISLLLLATRKDGVQSSAGRLLAVAVLLIGCITMGEYVFGWDAGIDQLFFAEPVLPAGTLFPGRMVLTTAIAFFLFGSMLLLIGRKNPWCDTVAHGMGLIVGLGGMIALLAYIYGLSDFSGYIIHTRMAIHTAISFIVLVIGAFCLQPGVGIGGVLLSEGPGSFVARRLISAAVIVPVALAGIVSMGEHQLYSAKFGDVLTATSLIVILVSLVWMIGRSLNNAHVEREKTERALRESEERYRSLTENLEKFQAAINTSGEAIFLTDKNGIITFINAGFTETYGYTAEEVVGRVTPRILKSGAMGAEVYVRFWKALAGGEIVGGELKNKRKDGTLIDIEGSANPIYDNQAQITGYLGIQRDITERKRTEEALQNERLLLRTLIDNIPDSIYSKDIESRKTLANAAELHISGARNERDVIGKNDFDLYPREIAEGFYADDQAVIRSGIPVLNREEFVRTNNDEKRWLLSSKIPLRDRDGNIIGLVGIGRDITERKAVEEMLVQSEARYRAIVENIGEGIGFVDTEECFLLANRAAEEIFGVDPGELVGMPLRRFVSDEQYAMIRNETSRRIEGQKSVYEFDIIRPNGERRNIILTAVPQNDGEKGFLGTLGVFRDITERKSLELELRSAQKMESLGIVAGGIAHDYNNILSIMIGNATLAQHELPPRHPAASYVDNAVKAMERATELTNQILAYTGKGSVVLHTCDVTDIVQRHCSFFAATISRGVSLEAHLPMRSIYVAGDQGQIRQVIANLCINSTEAIAGNHGMITVTLSEATMTHDDLLPYERIMKSPLDAGDYAVLTVKDTGAGMSRETMDKMFDPFFTTKFTGRGLGLSAVFGIINGHKGGIVVESEEGAGTVFHIILPIIARRHTATDPALTPTHVVSPAAAAILVIDDDEDHAGMARDMLVLGKYTAYVERSPVQGIEFFEQHQSEIGLVLVDLTMPELSGKEVVRRLKQIHPEVRIIVTTGYEQADTARRLGNETVSGYIQKPYRVKELLDVVHTVLM
jgi:PAS domain S-box-containing protein